MLVCSIKRPALIAAMTVLLLYTSASLSTIHAASSFLSVPTETLGVRTALTATSSPAVPSTLHLTFALNSGDSTNLDAFVSSLTDPTSSNYHRWLTPKEFGETFGANNADTVRVTQYLQQLGFTNIKVWSNHLFVSADNSTANIDRVFKTSIHNYVRSAAEIANGFSTTYYAPDTEPMVDSGVAAKLSGIFGLSNIEKRKPNFVRSSVQPKVVNSPLNPSDLKQLYDGGALSQSGYDGTGVTVAIFSPTTVSFNDINQFLTTNGLTNTHISVVNVNGGTNDGSNNVEACLDIETVVGEAPGATIKVYEGPNDGSLDIFNQMADDQPSIVTESYGSDENTVTNSFAASYETLRKQMAAEGISIIVASGDNGAYDSTTQSTVTVSVDADSAYVTSVGGTELQPFINNFWNGETAWTYNDGSLGSRAGSGGGLSVYISQPSWQKGPGVLNSESNGMRQIPDISALASTPFYNIYTQGAFSGYGGTSAACQFIGGSLALIEQQLGTKLGNINPQLYSFGTNDPAMYHDIVSGNNGVYSCTPNWDFVTGWGSPDIAKLALAFQGITTSATAIHTFTPGLQMISLPYSFAGNSTSSELLNGLATPSGTPAYIVATWDPASAAYDLSPVGATNRPAPGQGYWARFDSTVSGTLTAAATAVSSPTYSVALSLGWNIIGDPYLSPVSVDSLTVTDSSTSTSFSAASTAGVLQPYFFDYNGSAYVSHGSGDSIEPYDGYWIYASSPCTLTFSSQ